MKEINTAKKKVTLKERLFTAYQMAIELNVVGQYSYCLLILIETLQLLYFPFALKQNTDDSYSYVKLTLKIFLYVPYILDSFGSTAFFFVWIFHSLFLVIILGLMAFVVFRYKNIGSKPSFFSKVLIQILSLFLVLLKTILGIPAAMSFTVWFVCSRGLACWTGLNSILSVLSGIFLLLHFILIGATLLYVDSHIQPTLPWASPDSKVNTILQLLKFLIGFYVAADPDLVSGVYIFVLIIICLLYLLYQVYASKMIYNHLINCIEFLKIGIFLWCTICTYLCSAVQIYIPLDVGIMIILSGGFISIVLYMKQQRSVLEVLTSDITTTGEENAAVNAIAYLTELPNKIQKDAAAQWLLIGVLNLHRTTCKNENCVCHSLESKEEVENEKHDDFDMEQGKQANADQNPVSNFGSALNFDANASRAQIIQQRQEQEFNAINLQNQWKSFVSVIMEYIAVLFPKSVDIHLIIAYYQELFSKNFYKAFFQIMKIPEEGCSYAQQLAIYRMKVSLNKLICSSESARSNNAIDLDLNIYLKFESKRRELEHVMQDCTQKVMQFWGLLLSVNLKIDKMYTLGGEISCALQKTHEIFNEIINIFPDHIKTYVNYSRFLKEVANNEIESEEYQEKADQINKNLEVGKSQTFAENNMFSINRETAIIIISGNQSNLAAIIHANEYVQEIFGYTYNNLVGFSVNRLMPKLIASVHNKFLQQFHDTGKVNLINSEKLLFGQSKNGLLIPMAILVKMMPGIEDGVKYIGFMRRDMNYIKRNLIKLPYQYQKNQKIGFILTDIKGNITGISEHAAKALEIPISYFEKKKSLFSETFNIGQLNKKLVNAEDEEELKKGTVLDLKLKHIMEMIDKDFLTQEDINNIEQKKECAIYIQLVVYEFSYGLKYKVFVIVPLKHAIAKGMSSQDDKEEEQKEKEENLDYFGSAASSMGTAQLNDKLRPLYKELKKNTFERQESKQITIVKRMIYATLLLLFVLSLVDLVYYAFLLTGVQNLFKLNESAHYRRNLIQTMLEEVQSYREVALGNEARNSTFESDRKLRLQINIGDSLERVKENEYKFQERLKNIDIKSITSVCVSPGVTYQEMYIDSTINYAAQGLGITIVQMVSKINRLINEVSISTLNTPFIKGIYNQTLKVSTKLTQSEKDFYFVIRNGIYNVMNASTTVISSIDDSYSTLMNTEQLLFFILHLLRWIIYVITIFAVIPIIQKVQSGKRAILQFFAEVPKKRIEQILKECESFYNKQQKFENLESKDDSLGHIDEKKDAENTNLRTTITQNNSGTHMNHKETEQKNENAENEEVEHDAKAGLKEEVDTRDEENFKEERKNKFMAYKAGIGLIFLLFLIAILSIAAYQSGIFAFQMFRHKDFNSNYDFVNTLQQRWYYLASTMVFFLSTTQTYYIKDSTGISRFDNYSSLLLSLEDQINSMLVQYPSNQEKVATMLRNLIKQNFCNTSYKDSSLYSQNISSIWCNTIKNGLLQHGIRTTIFFLLTELKMMFLTLTTNKVLPRPEFLLDDKLIFEYALVPTFDYLISSAVDSQYQLAYESMLTIIMHYVALFIITLIVLFVLIKFFANRLNNELWNAKGIVTLLPLDLIEKSKNLRELFGQQMNIML